PRPGRTVIVIDARLAPSKMHDCGSPASAFIVIGAGSRLATSSTVMTLRSQTVAGSGRGEDFAPDADVPAVQAPPIDATIASDTRGQIRKRAMTDSFESSTLRADSRACGVTSRPAL